MEPAAELGASVNGQGREQDVAKKSKVLDGQGVLLESVPSVPQLPSNADARVGKAMVDIAEFMRLRLDDDADLAEHPQHRELRDWASRLGARGAARLPDRDRLRRVG
jgi:hypothetical protein